MPVLTAPPTVRPIWGGTTEQLLRRRAALPAGHPERAELRRRAIEENLPLARRLARRYAGRGEAVDDLIQVASLALIRAVDGYDPTRSTLFVAYAGPSIVGALKRHFRDTSWVIHVPRSTQELVLLVRAETGRLGQRLGHTPTRAELADHLGVSLDRLRAAEGAASAFRPGSLDAAPLAIDGVAGPGAVDRLGAVDPGFEAVEDQLVLRGLLLGLPARDRRLLALRFSAELSQIQIATAIGVSQMQVSRLLRRCLAHLELAGRPRSQTSTVD